MDNCIVPHFKAKGERFNSGYTRTSDGLMLLFQHGRDFVSAQTILVLRSERNYTRLYFSNGKKYLSSCTLGNLLYKLPADLFIRIHHGHAVNRKYIKSVHKDCVFLIDGSRWEISRRKQKQILQTLNAASE